MANVSNWKGSERKAARLFPGGVRRPRVGGTYALLADDVCWGAEKLLSHRRPPRIVKRCLNVSAGIGGVYIDCKKKAKSALFKEFIEVEKKYLRRKIDRLVLVTHRKGDHRQLVTVDDQFFGDLIRAWCAKYGLFSHEMMNEGVDKLLRST